MKTTVFVRFFLPYFVVLSMSLIVFSGVYRATSRVVRSTVLSSGNRAMESGKDLLDSRFAEMDRMIAHLNDEEEIRSFLQRTAPLSSPDFYAIRRVIDRLSTYSTFADFTEHIYMYFRNSNSVVSSSYSDMDTERFYRNTHTYVGMTYDTWIEAIAGGYREGVIWPERDLVTPSGKKSVLTYVQSIPTGLFSTFRGVIWLDIQASSLWGHFESVPHFSEGSFAVLRSDGALLAVRNGNGISQDLVDAGLESTPGTYLTDAVGKSTIFLRTRSQHKDLIYVLALPSEAVLGQVNYVTTVFAGTSLVLIVVGLAFSLTFANRNTRPIQRLLRLVSDKDGLVGGDPLVFLEGSVASLIQNNTSLQTELAERMPLLRSGVLERLIRGSYQSEQEAATALAAVGISAQAGRRFVVASIMLNRADMFGVSNENRDVERVLISKLIADALPGETVMHFQESDTVAALICYPGVESESIHVSLRRIVPQLLESISEENGIVARAGIGSEAVSLRRVNESFSQAQTALDRVSATTGESVLWFSDLHLRPSGFFYPLEREESLIRNTRAGNIEAVEDVLSELEDMNDLSELSPFQRRQFVSEITGTIERLRGLFSSLPDDEGRQVTGVMMELSESADDSQFFKRVRLVFRTICEAVDRTKLSHNDQLRHEIVSYIESNYSDPNLGLTMIADSFGLTEGYLSHFFKEQTGINFSSYVERLRMTAIRELVKHDDIGIADAATRVGYQNQNTFYRACKRVFGVNPSALKELVRSSDG